MWWNVLCFTKARREREPCGNARLRGSWMANIVQAARQRNLGYEVLSRRLPESISLSKEKLPRRTSIASNERKQKSVITLFATGVSFRRWPAPKVNNRHREARVNFGQVPSASIPRETPSILPLSDKVSSFNYQVSICIWNTPPPFFSLNRSWCAVHLIKIIRHSSWID